MNKTVILTFPYLPLGHLDGMFSEERIRQMDVCYIKGSTLAKDSDLNFNSLITIFDYDAEGHEYLKKSNVDYAIAIPPPDKADEFILSARKRVENGQKLQELYNVWTRLMSSIVEDKGHLIIVDIGKALEDYIEFTDDKSNPANDKLQKFILYRRNSNE